MHINAFFKNYIKCHLIASKICFFCTQEKKENKQQDVNTKSFVFSNSFYWPVKNMIFKYFNQTQLNNKNIKIVGIKGQSIFSISSGEVVCVTDMFKQYGKLIIIKHGLNYLSIYGFNDSVLVKEGDKIHAQQKIATMGVSSEKNIVQLYFEIRYKGESINPFYILPKISRLK